MTELRIKIDIKTYTVGVCCYFRWHRYRHQRYILQWRHQRRHEDLEWEQYWKWRANKCVALSLALAQDRKKPKIQQNRETQWILKPKTSFWFKIHGLSQIHTTKWLLALFSLAKISGNGICTDLSLDTNENRFDCTKILVVTDAKCVMMEHFKLDFITLDEQSSF